MNLVKEIYDAKSFIVKQGETSSCIYIIKEGEVECLIKNQVIRTLKKGESFGEISILLDSNRTMDVIAKTNCVCYAITVDTLKMIIGEKFRETIFFNIITMAFENSKNFANIEPSSIEKSFETFSTKKFNKFDVIFAAGYNALTKLVIVAEGNLINVTLNLLN
jgi:hypothetical protein